MTRHLILSRFHQPVGQVRISKVIAASAVCGLVFMGGCKPSPNGEVSAAPQVGQTALDNQSETPAVVSAETPVPTTPKPPASQKSSRAATDERIKTAPAGKVVSIAGGWVNEGGACDSGASVFFNADGTYLSEGEKGTWNLSGKTLTVTTSSSFDEVAASPQGPEESVGDSGEKAVLTLLSITDDAARVVLSNGSNASWTRCTS